MFCMISAGKQLPASARSAWRSTQFEQHGKRIELEDRKKHVTEPSPFTFLPFYLFTPKNPFYLFTFLLFTLQISLFTFLPFYFFTSKSPFYLFTFLLFYFSKKQGFFASQTRLLLNANKASFQCKEALFESDIKSY